MKLINIKKMSPAQDKAFRICMAGSVLSFDREDSIEALQEQIAAIEPDSKTLGRALAVPHLGRIDLVCVDGAGKLITVCACDELSADELGQSIMRGRWASENMDILQHIYSRRFAAEDVRVWIVARSVSPAASALISRMGADAPEFFTCEALELGGEDWLVVRRQGNPRAPAAAAAVDPKPLPKAAWEPVEEKGPVGIRSVLTREEIDDFFAPAGGDEEEITNGGSVFRDL
ncbi:MAG: hypothetical protein WC683_11330 [bacterium]